MPDEKLDTRGIRHTWAMIYGLDSWNSFFTPRQAISLLKLVDLLKHGGPRGVLTQRANRRLPSEHA